MQLLSRKNKKTSDEARRKQHQRRCGRVYDLTSATAALRLIRGSCCYFLGGSGAGTKVTERSGC